VEASKLILISDRVPQMLVHMCYTYSIRLIH
jgi:hypothetical protein